VATRRSFEEAAADHSAIYDAWWQYLDGLLTRLESGGLPDAETAIAALRRGIGEKTAQPPHGTDILGFADHFACNPTEVD
jgi:hypothetical protein